MVGGSARVRGQHSRHEHVPRSEAKIFIGATNGDKELHTVFEDIVHLRSLDILRLARGTMTHDVLPSLRVGKDELVGRDPDDLAILTVQLEDIEREPARHEAVAVWNPRCAHPKGAGELAQRVEEDVVDDMAQEVGDELGRAAGVSCGTIPAGRRRFYPACV